MRALLLLVVPVAVAVLLMGLAVRRSRRADRVPEPYRHVEPPPRPASTGVRVLTSPEDLADALERAAEGERRVADMVSGRIERYERLHHDDVVPRRV